MDAQQHLHKLNRRFRCKAGSRRRQRGMIAVSAASSSYKFSHLQIYKFSTSSSAEREIGLVQETAYGFV